MRYTIYEYDPATGFIGSQTSKDLPEDSPVLTLDNQVVTNSLIPAHVTTAHADGHETTQKTLVDSGWSFVLENGKPVQDQDGNYKVIPPQIIAPPPDKLAHIFSGLVKAGYIDVSEVDQATINSINWSLATENLPVIRGTNLIPMPVRTALTSSVKG